jgi:aspartate dehydrogenase
MSLPLSSANDRDKAQKRLSALSRTVPVVAIEALEPLADIVIECAPAALLPSIATPFLRNGKTVIVSQRGAIAGQSDLIELAKHHGGQIVVPTGALLGLDAVTAAAEGEIRRVTMISKKPIAGLLGAPHLVTNRINIEGITEPMRVFRGNAREAAVGFPANLNVAVALSLAGIGPEPDHCPRCGPTRR